jgi:hypothetical protein
VNVHRVADDQRSAFVAAQHAGRERPGHLQLADIGRGDLIEFRVPLIGIVAGRHHPLLGVLRQLDQFVVGGGGTCGDCRHGTNTGCE